MADQTHRNKSINHSKNRNMRGMSREHDNHNRSEGERKHHNDERGRSDRRGYSSGSYSTQSSTAGFYCTDRPHLDSKNDSHSRGRGIESSQRGKDRSSSWNEYNVDWKCHECRTWNHKKEEFCKRCDARRDHRGDDRRRSESRGRRSMSDAEYRRDRPRDKSRQEDDYYGPNKRSRGERWPPPFDASDSCYIFDSRSGLFYESETNFFYDPKTKLYYGNNQQKYFQYIPDGKPPYREVSQDQRQITLKEKDTKPIDELNVSKSEKTLTGDDLAKDESEVDLTKKNDKMKIAICLKTKPGTFSTEIPTPTIVPPLVLQNKESEHKANPTQSTQTKQHEADMEKWSQRVKEINEDSKEPENTKDSSNSNSSSFDAKKSTVATTTKGKPVCLLCRRKFASLEKLKQHENLSDLHKQNLEKKLQKKAAKLQNTAYRDRAKERRSLYGSDKPVASMNQDESVVIGPSLTKARTVSSAETVSPDEILGDTNVGNKLLQKLGWNGGSLGRGDNAKNNLPSSQQAVSEKLKQDWKRIESIAGGHTNI